MAKIISREAQPGLFSEDEKSVSEILNAVEVAYSLINTKPAGYNQQELLKDLREAGINSYESNMSISILFQCKKIISMID